MTFQNRLIELRNTRNLTQKQIAESVGISVLGYQRYEYGVREPAFHVLISLADYFNVSIDYLVGRTDNPEINR